MRNLQTSENLFREYKSLADNEASVFSKLKTDFPGYDFAKHGARVWRFAVLAELWGKIASELSSGKHDHLGNWRTGKNKDKGGHNESI